MGYNPAAIRRRLNLSTNSDLVEQCKSKVGNFSADVESLLAADLEQREQRGAPENAASERAIDAFAALYNSEVSFSEEFQDF